MPRKTPFVIGHRGAAGYLPEHTRASYALAMAQGVDAVEPDVVATGDGVLVVRHENEISATTDIADRPEFAARRTTRTVDGRVITGWFTEDFTWDELATLRCRERLPALRPDSAARDGEEPILRLTDLLDLVRAGSAAHRRRIGVVLEIKHASHFRAAGIDLVPLLARDLRAAGWGADEGVAGEGAAEPAELVIESFESTVLQELRACGVAASWVYLLEAAGAPADTERLPAGFPATYADALTPSGLDALVGVLDGVSVDKRVVLKNDGPAAVDRAHARGLAVFAWTCRPENMFLAPEFRGSGGDGAFGDYEAEWSALAAAGVDGVFVDHPDLGVAVFRQ